MGTAKYTISSPTGIDKPIQKLQSYFASKLFTGKDYNSYGRIYSNEKEDSIIPEIYNGKDYEELFTNDKLDGLSFFRVVDSEAIEYNRHIATVDIIFSCDLSTLYPTLTHRADETALNEILDILRKEPYGFKVNNVSRDLDTVYTGFTLDRKQVRNMQPFYHVKIECELIYNQSC